MTLGKEKIEDLFLMMSMKDEDIELAHQAFNEFHRRYAEYLYNVTKKVCANFLHKYGDTLIEIIFSHTLLKVYEKSGTFVSIDEIDDTKKERRVKAWLGKIASNELNTVLRENLKTENKIVYDTDFINKKDIIEDASNVNNINNAIEYVILDGALKSLKERDQEILLTYYMYYEEGKNMPSEKLDELCEIYSTTKANLRQIKKRSLEKIKNYITEYKKNRSYGK